MKFVSCDRIQEGMVLAKDLHLFDKETNKVLLLRKNARLNEAYIARLRELSIAGAYIKDGVADEVQIHTVMEDKEKIKAVLEIKNVFDTSLSLNNEITQEDVDKLSHVATSLVQKVQSDDFVRVSISDLKSFDDFLYHHSLSVCVLAIALGKEIGMSTSQLSKLGLASLLHDIGKTLIPKEIVNKKEPLTFVEYDRLKKHPELGAQYLEEHNLVDKDVLDGIRYHHERFDGSGYPSHLKGSEIPLFARIIAICDVYDALTSNRPNRAPWQPTEAYEYLFGNAGRHFDFDLVFSFMRKIEPYPIGSCVQLSNGEVAIVTETFDELPLRPIVRVINSNKVYDLQNDLSLISLVIKGYYADSSFEEIRG